MYVLFHLTDVLHACLFIQCMALATPEVCRSISGYCGERSFLEKIHDVVTELKKISPDCTFCASELFSTCCHTYSVYKKVMLKYSE